MSSPPDTMGSADWLDANNRYLAQSLRWLRLKLQARLPHAGADRAAPSPAPAPAPVVVKAPPPVVVEVTPPAPPQRTWFAQRPAPAFKATAVVVEEVATAPAPAPSAPNASGDTDPASRDSADADTAASSAATAAAIRDAAAERATSSAGCQPPPALEALAQAFGLSDFERDTLLLCAAVELDPQMGALYAAVSAALGAGTTGQPARAYPSFALALQVLDDPSWDAMSPQRALRHLRLVEVNAAGTTPLTLSPLRADERIVNLIKGLNELDDRLAALLQPVPATDAQALLAPSQQAAVQALVDELPRTPGGLPWPGPLQLLGNDAASKLAVAQAISAAVGCSLWRLAPEALPAERAELEPFARLWQRERGLLPLALYIDAEHLDAASADAKSALGGFLARDPGWVFVSLADLPAVPWMNSPSIEIGRPTVTEQHEAWQQALPAELGWPTSAPPSAPPTASPRPIDRAQAARLLAGQFDLGLADLRRAAMTTTATPTFEAIWDACRSVTRPRLDALAQRIEPKATWDDLVLPAEALGLLRQIAAQVQSRYQVFEDWGYAQRMTRGLGLSVLFAGESGTGKTMAAEVIADALRLNLYRIDLSAVVSKYIGETEKNLRRLFDAAEQGGAILFFDEADALFGKRSEVKDSHDRYANIEINYLLQRMESFGGLAILATNMKSALDTAFLRRLRFIVNFPFPGAAERKAIWQKAWPPGVPLQEIDYDRLARSNLSGGNVHSVALNAAFAAAQQGTPVTMPLLMQALRTELRKLDKPVNEAEFR